MDLQGSRTLICLGERGFALLTGLWRTLQHITASPRQDRRHRSRRARPHPFRARNHAAQPALRCCPWRGTSVVAPAVLTGAKTAQVGSLGLAAPKPSGESEGKAFGRCGGGGLRANLEG